MGEIIRDRSKPSEMSAQDLGVARKVAELSLVQPWPDLASDLDLEGHLYYPIRQVPLASFQFEMLLWDKDKLNVFAESDISISGLPLSGNVTKFDDVVARYKRVDDYTVLAVAVDASGGVAVFTSEISQTTWELIGIFSIKQPKKVLEAHSKSLVQYDNIEHTYQDRLPALASDPGDTNLEDDTYWARYDVEEESELPEAPKDGNDDEGTYWDSYDRESHPAHEVTTSGHHELVVQSLIDLAPLYVDCGLSDTTLIIADLTHLALHRAAPIGDVPPIAHRHARRVIDSLQNLAGISSQDVLLASQQIKQATSLLKAYSHLKR